MIKVFVCAQSPAELARLEALIRSVPSLRLAGGSLGKSALIQQIADTLPDVLLEQTTEDYLEGLLPRAHSETREVPRVLLLGEHQFPDALSALRTTDSDLRGILPFGASESEILAAVEAAAAGLIVWHPDLMDYAATTIEGETRPPPGQQLSPRESEILSLLAGGLGNKEIAWQLGISDHTVKYHVASIFDKLHVSTRAEAVAIGIRHGLIAL